MLKLVLKMLWHPVPWNRKKQHVHRFHLYNLTFHPFITAFGMSPFGIWVEMNFMDLRHEMRETASWEIKTQKAGKEKCAPSSACLVCGSCKRIAQNLSYLSFFWSTCCDWLWLRCHSILWKGPTTLPSLDECKTQFPWFFTLSQKTGSSRRFKRFPATYRWVSSQLPFTEE